MMTKQEQIEAMEKIIDELYNVYDTTADDIAEGLYNAGYRKIPENVVVLTKEEYEDLKVAADNYDPFWFCSFGGCEGARKGCKDDCEMSIFVQERKKTAKEILLLLGKGYDEKEKTEFNNLQWYKEFCRELKHRYGVEVEE